MSLSDGCYSALGCQKECILEKEMSRLLCKYWLGDLLAGTLTGAVVALAHHALVPRSFGILGALILAMFVGMTVQMIISVSLGSLLGSMEMMIPGMFVGMIAMFLPVLGLPHLGLDLGLGAALGLVVFFGFNMWNARLEGRELTCSPPNGLGKISEKTKQGSRNSSGWWSFPRFYDALEYAGSKRRAAAERELFQAMDGKVLFAAAGTGLNFANFPPGKNIVAVDRSREMLRVASRRAKRYEGSLALQEAHLEQLPFASESFDTVATASTLCSVANPLKSLREVHRVLKPGARLLMFEHVRSRNPVLALELGLMSLLLRHVGPEMNRDTVGTAQRAGFVIDRIRCAYLDIFLAIEAHKPISAAATREADHD